MNTKDKIFASKISRIEDFEFDRKVADAFDDMLERSVPFYSEIQRMVVELAANFAKNDSTVYDLGCSTGNTLLLLARRITDPSIRFVGLDKSKDMLQKSREKLEKYKVLQRCELAEADFNKGIELHKPSVAIMNWSLQFVRPLYRDVLISKIYKSLPDRGCFVLMEKVLIPDSILNRIYLDLYHGFKGRKGYSELEISQKRESLENILIPYKIDENITLLKQNGFEIVDVFFRWYNWAGFLAVKYNPH